MSFKGDLIKLAIYYIIEIVKDILFKDDSGEQPVDDHPAGKDHPNRGRDNGGQ